MQPKALTGLRPQSYEHPLDKRALDALEGTPGLETLVRKCNEWGAERLFRIRFTGSHFRVTPDGIPDLYEKVRSACATLDIPRVPEIYIQGSGGIGAMTVGVEKPILVLTSACVDLMSDNELLFVIGNVLGHIKSGHSLYYQIAEYLPKIGQMVGAATFGIGDLIFKGLNLAFLNWQRMANFTADRAGLLACQDADAAIRAMMKISGVPQKYYDSMNPEDFIAQAREFADFDLDKFDRVAKIISTMGASHPWTVMRAGEFLKWVDTGDYDQLLASPATPPVPAVPVGKSFCPRCGAAQRTAASFCGQCGAKL